MPEWIDNGEIVSLLLPETFSYQECLVYLTRSDDECLYHISNGVLTKLFCVEGQHIVIELNCQNNKTLDIRFVNVVPTKPIRTAIVQYVWKWFDLETNLFAFYEMASNDALLNPLVQRYYGLRIIGIPDLFEALCWAILGQQINLRFAYSLKRKLVEAFGEHLQIGDQIYWLFPTPEILSQVSVEKLKELQFTAKKAEYIIHIAEQMASGTLSKESLQSMKYADIEHTLVKIRGIGPWTANYVLMRCFRDPSAFPIADVGLHNAIKQQLQMDRKPTLDEIRQLSETWRGWEAYATFYLWRSLYN